MAQHVALVPRLTYSQGLLDKVAGQLSAELAQVRRLSTGKITSAERDIMLCFESVVIVKQQLSDIKSLSDMSGRVIDTIPAVRAVSAKLSCMMPSCSRLLCELAIYLGSIAADSAILSGVPVRTSRYGGKSWHLLDKAKTVTDSKLRKLQANI